MKCQHYLVLRHPVIDGNVAEISKSRTQLRGKETPATGTLFIVIKDFFFMKKFVAVAGNIGVGKSTLVSLLCQRLKWEPFFEPESENPYLPDFYEKMKRWAFHSQVFFLTHRLRIHQQIIEHPNSVIQDRSVYEDAEIFAQNLYNQKHIRDRDFDTYWELYQVLSKFLPPPDLVVYLRASVPSLKERIAARGRNGARRGLAVGDGRALQRIHELGGRRAQRRFR